MNGRHEVRGASATLPVETHAAPADQIPDTDTQDSAGTIDGSLRGDSGRHGNALLQSAEWRGIAPVLRSPSLGPLERWTVEALRRRLGNMPVRIVLWTGYSLDLGTAPVATVRIATRHALVDLARNPEFEFGEHFMAGDIEVEGDLVALLTCVFGRAAGANGKEVHHSNPLGTSRENVHQHYDLGNDFYRLWLDEEMLYTCAYFPSPAATLEEAQIAKMELVCRKMNLQPGERVVEAGCGWGALALYMAREYGVTVKAYNISREQIAYARARAEREGLAARVTFVEEDYRVIHETADVFISVGMLEHVGPADYQALGRVIRRTLGDGRGRGFLHFIGRSRPAPLNAWIARRIFPGAYPPTLPEAVKGVLEPHDYAVLDVENLRLHYALTLDHWRRRFLAASADVCRLFDDRFARAWLLYLSGSQAAFLSGALQLFQLVFAPAGNGALRCARRP